MISKVRRAWWGCMLFGCGTISSGVAGAELWQALVAGSLFGLWGLSLFSD